MPAPEDTQDAVRAPDPADPSHPGAASKPKVGFTSKDERPALGSAAWLLGAALVLWILGASIRSLWGDEFHSMHHALTEDLPSFLSSVRSDNHPPLSFLLERLSIGVFGLSDVTMRLPSIGVGLAYLLLLRQLCARLGGRPKDARDEVWRAAARLTPWLVLGSSYCFYLLTEARMYPLLMLATLGTLLVLIHAYEDGRERRPSPWWLTLWVAIGLHAHYYFVHQLIVAALCVLVLVATAARMRARTKPLVLPGLVGLLLWAPWAWYGFRTQLTHDLPPGGAQGTLSTLVQSVAHFFFWNATLAGDWLVKGAAWPGSVVAGIALLLGLVRILQRWRERPEERVVLGLVLGFGVGTLLWSWSASHVFSRSTFGWRYVAGAAAPMLWIAALGVSGPALARRVLLVALGLSMCAVTAANVFSGGREDHQRLVRFVLERTEPGDAVVVKPPWDREKLRSETTWAYYLARVEVPPGTPIPPDFGYDQLQEADAYDRVWVWFRDPYYQWVRRHFAETFDTEQIWAMGPDMTLHLFSNP